MIRLLIEGILAIKATYFSVQRNKFGYISKSSKIVQPSWGPTKNVYVYENCGINAGAKFLCTSGKFVLSRNCSVGPNLTVITFNHAYNSIGERPESNGWNNLIPDDVIVNEDVWIGANVTLCPGTNIGRGCLIAAGSVCVKNQYYPPYSIIGGNPSKFIRFRLNLEEQIKQEELLYNDQDRISTQQLIGNFNKYYLGK